MICTICGKIVRGKFSIIVHKTIYLGIINILTFNVFRYEETQTGSCHGETFSMWSLQLQVRKLRLFWGNLTKRREIMINLIYNFSNNYCSIKFSFYQCFRCSRSGTLRRHMATHLNTDPLKINHVIDNTG